MRKNGSVLGIISYGGVGKRGGEEEAKILEVMRQSGHGFEKGSFAGAIVSHEDRSFSCSYGKGKGGEKKAIMKS